MRSFHMHDLEACSLCLLIYYGHFSQYQHRLFHSFIDSVFAEFHHITSTVLGAGDIALNKTDDIPCPHGAYSLLEGDQQSQMHVTCSS